MDFQSPELEKLTPQELEKLFKYLDDPLNQDFPQELEKISELELLGLQLMLSQLMDEKRNSPLH
jgi:hypothetical protein